MENGDLGNINVDKYTFVRALLADGTGFPFSAPFNGGIIIARWKFHRLLFCRFALCPSLLPAALAAQCPAPFKECHQ
ncbi:hypothetical protein [Noviherbaspirillum sp. UKPF54]|uniref:hypothetical protein n=1 Tax=Noviherbaspirillum sp. UKPF54 TaxID=2601898 RepID=UPI00143D4A9D|nr:hypothetical protein [Noviherbaspirillum sp. UKPF54]